jgi:hypothetical protein
VTAHPPDVPAYCFPAMDEAGQYERADAPPGGTTWDLARALAPAAIVLPGCQRDVILRGQRPLHGGHPHSGGRADAGGFPPGWGKAKVIGAVLAVARDPDRITWDDPAAWPGADIIGSPGWRAEGTVDAVTITVALRAGGEIIGARPAEEPGAGRAPSCRVPRSPVSQRAHDAARQHERAQA